MKVLEIGTGFGYNAAVVAEIIGQEGHIHHRTDRRPVPLAVKI